MEPRMLNAFAPRLIRGCFIAVLQRLSSSPITALAQHRPLLRIANFGATRTFGCQDNANWTSFGDAFFNVALRRAKSLRDAFVAARAVVQKRELREHFEPSNPLMAGGANVQPLLIAHP